MYGASAHVSLTPFPKEARSGHTSTAHKFLFLCDRFVRRSTLRWFHDRKISGSRRGSQPSRADMLRRTNRTFFLA